MGLRIRGCLGSIPTGGNILTLDFFHIVNPLMPILPLLPIFQFAKNPNDSSVNTHLACLKLQQHQNVEERNSYFYCSIIIYFVNNQQHKNYIYLSATHLVYLESQLSQISKKVTPKWLIITCVPYLP